MRHLLQDNLTWLEKVASQHEYVLFQPTWADPLDLASTSRIQLLECPGVPRQRPGRVLYEQLVYPALIHRAAVDVFLGFNSVLPLRLRIPSVVVMQALQYFDFPQIYSWPNLVYLRTIVPWTIRKATRIIALSEISKETIVAHCGIDADRIRVVYHGLPSAVLQQREAESDEWSHHLVRSVVGDRPYILCVSSFYWHKNLPRLVEAFALLKRRPIPHALLLIGADSPKVTRRRLLDLAAQLGVADSVICPGVVPHPLIPAFYRSASAMVMPSLYETFGLPVLEAMSCGCPIVTSHMGTMAEVAADCAVLVDPYSVESIADGMTSLLQDAGRRERLVEQARVRARAFTLEAQALGYARVLEEAA